MGGAVARAVGLMALEELAVMAVAVVREELAVTVVAVGRLAYQREAPVG